MLVNIGLARIGYAHLRRKRNYPDTHIGKEQSGRIITITISEHEDFAMMWSVEIQGARWPTISQSDDTVLKLTDLTDS
jgi:hypothetical protein